jgi:hypothetical protein
MHELSHHFNDFVDQLMLHPISTIVAGGAAVSPIWMPWLQSLSNDAALFLPILGCLWFVFQFARALWK